MSQPDPAAAAEGRAVVGFIPHRIQPGPPMSILCLLGAGGIMADAGLGSGAGFGGGGRSEGDSGVGG